MSSIHPITLWAAAGEAQKIGVECRLASSTSNSKDGTPLQTIDAFFLARPDLTRPSEAKALGSHEILLQIGQHENQVLTTKILGPENALGFLQECLRAATETLNLRVATARFVIPLQSGTVIRSDIIPYRLQDAFWAGQVVSFASPLQEFPGTPLPVSALALREVFRASAGAILLKASALHRHPHPGADVGFSAAAATLPADVEADFADKLATVPWISARPVTRRRLVLVGSSNQDPEGGGWTQFAHRAAVALGIDLVIVDRADGWLALGDYESWYEALLPAPPASWWAEPSADTLVDLVEGYRASHRGERPIDGIVTFVEALQTPVSVAAERLGLPHESTEAFERATNKYNLGLFQNRPALLASTTEDVLARVRAPESELRFPLIVKPCYGLNSEGVTRVDEASELAEAIEAARRCKRITSDVGDRVLVERYCEGPEVDVNMVFVDGEVLFSEICDDFPKGADLNNFGIGADSTAAKKPREAAGKPSPDHRRNFQETNMVFPSALPGDELAALRDAVKTTILGLGFKNGVMHVEARIAQSKYSYQSTDGVVDLRKQQASAAEDVPTPWVIEVNPRPPGLFASQTPGSVYGIDYWGVSLLLAAGDKARAAALLRPFANGAQSHTVLVMIRAEFDAAREGIFDSDDVCAELLARHPELAEHLGRYGCLLKRGQKIPHPSGGRNTFVAYLNVFSRTSRQEALAIAKKVREEIRYDIR